MGCDNPLVLTSATVLFRFDVTRLLLLDDRSESSLACRWPVPALALAVLTRWRVARVRKDSTSLLKLPERARQSAFKRRRLGTRFCHERRISARWDL